MAGKTILLVADQERDRRYLEWILEEAGFHVRSLDVSRDALKAAQAERPDLILLDLVVDDMDGFKTCRELSLNRDTRHIPVLMVSDQHQQVDRLWAEQQGADGLVAKPCSAEEVLEQVRRLI